MTREELIQFLTLLKEQARNSGANTFVWDVKIDSFNFVIDSVIKALAQESKTGYCKDCKYFEYDSVAKVDGIPLIVAHEICKRWGNGCKTREDGYCFLFEPQESEG